MKFCCQYLLNWKLVDSSFLCCCFSHFREEIQKICNKEGLVQHTAFCLLIFFLPLQKEKSEFEMSYTLRARGQAWIHLGLLDEF